MIGGMQGHAQGDAAWHREQNIHLQMALADTEALVLSHEERIEKLTKELETERMRLAACGVAALGYFDGCKDEYRSASLEDTVRLYDKYLQVTKQRDELLKAADQCYRMLLSEPETKKALFKAEDILREAIASVKEGS